MFTQLLCMQITAAIRPNPVFTYDDLIIPAFSPSQLNETTLNAATEFDAVGLDLRARRV
jgi:hypothetical protein